MTILPELIHYSHKPIDARSITYRNQRAGRRHLEYDMKPNGLWVSADENGEGHGFGRHGVPVNALP